MSKDEDHKLEMVDSDFPVYNKEGTYFATEQRENESIEDFTNRFINEQTVSNFSNVMLTKLEMKRKEGKNGWCDPKQCGVEKLTKLLEIELRKDSKDPVDIANYAMMIFVHLHGHAEATMKGVEKMKTTLAEIEMKNRENSGKELH